jgi:hypothetical protein
MQTSSAPRERLSIHFYEHDILVKQPTPNGTTCKYVTPTTLRAALSVEIGRAHV